MIIEILYSEVCNLFGDIGNVRYLEKSLPNAKFIYTRLGEKPFFTDNRVDCLYIGSMTEKVQKLVINELSPYTKILDSMIKNNTLIIATGNAVDVFGKSIVDKSGDVIECLNLVNISVKRDMFDRYSGLVLAEKDGLDFVGFRAQFTETTVHNSDDIFLTVKKGRGMNENCNYEGIKVNSFYGTNLLGPFLLFNPHFTKKILSEAFGADVELAFEKETIDAYQRRLMDFNRESIKVH